MTSRKDFWICDMDSLERKRRKAVRKGFRQRLTRKFRLELISEDELRSVFSRMVSGLDGIVFLLVVVAVISVCSILLYKASPSQKRYVDRDYILRQQIVYDMLRMDSIEEIVSQRDYYVRNVQNILSGRVDADSVSLTDSIPVADRHLSLAASEEENVFVDSYEEQERYNVASQGVASEVLSRNIFRPASGTVSVSFDANMKHYGVDLAANPNESVMSVMDGTVVFSSYTAEDGYVICIHHPGDMMSVYKSCSSLLRKQGDKVKAGDVIALTGSIGKDDSASQLHFELWYEGQPVDPQKYIVF